MISQNSDLALPERGGDGVDDVAENLLQAGQPVRHLPQLAVRQRALHPMAGSCK